MIKMFHFLFALLLFLCVFSCTRPEKAEPKLKTNSPPVIISVRIFPENPSRENDLTGIVHSTDPDQDSVTYQYQWMKNDEELVGETNNILKSGSFKKGDLIRLKVVPSDGKTVGKPFLSDPVKILNIPPVIQEVWIEPRVAKVGDDLRANIKSSDGDRDPLYFSYQWEKNGTVLVGERGEILAGNLFKKGDSITVTVTPDDRETIGSPKKSDPVIIINSPPSILSTPPKSTEGPKYSYQVKAIDPDGDPITYTIKSGPKGMTIDAERGLIKWEIRPGEKGTYPIEIEVFDQEGASCKQRFTLSVEIVPKR